MTSQIVIIYILKAILISGIFLAYYWMALRDKKFHYYNRFYLLTASVMSLLIPLLKLNWFTVEKPVLYSSNEIVQFILPIPNANKSIELNWIDYFLALAVFVAITLLSILLLNVIKIQLLKRKYDVTKMDGFDFVNTNEDNAPFSFLNNLFWKQSISLQEEGGQQIFKHEITHIQQKHTWDRIYCQILTSIFWMNPFNWVIQKELVAIHEFIADEEAVGNSNVEAFAKMLLQTHYGNHFLNPIHQFFYSSIKRRLTMLTKSTNTKYSYLRRVMVLPVLIASVTLVSIKVNASEKVENKVQEIKNGFSLLVNDTSKPANKSSVKSLPTPPTPPKVKSPTSISYKNKNKIDQAIAKIDQAIAKFEEQIPKSFQSRAEIDRQLTQLDQQITKADVGKSKDILEKAKANLIEARSVVEKSKADLEESKADLEKEKADLEKEKAEQEKEKAVLIKSRTNQGNSTKILIKPAYYLDGVKITEKQMYAIPPNDIASVDVWKGEEAIKKYPKEGKNGVVFITTKKANKDTLQK